MIKFCHISPHCLEEGAIAMSGAHLTLAHLVEEMGNKYTSRFQDGKDIIMDNSVFERHSEGREVYPPERLLGMGYDVGADYIVMPDYPGEPGEKTMDAAEELGHKFKEHGFKTVFVPQSRFGELDDYLETFEWGIGQDWIDLIGVSILGVPNAYGIEAQNRLQRFTSRWKIMHDLICGRILNDNHYGRLHFLGMTEGPNEILLVKEFKEYINSWDSSAAVWAGMQGIEFDTSPTGLMNGKIGKHVDFQEKEPSPIDRSKVMANIMFINALIDRL